MSDTLLTDSERARLMMFLGRTPTVDDIRTYRRTQKDFDQRVARMRAELRVTEQRTDAEARGHARGLRVVHPSEEE